MWPTRRAVVGDYAAVRRLFMELGVPEPPPEAAEFEARMLPGVLVACDGEAVIGYSYRRVYGRTAHVVHVAVAPEAQGRGVGGVLMAATREAIGAACSRWFLNVKRDNTPALRLYERYGFAIERDIWALALPWSRVDALAGDAAIAGDVAPAYAPGPEEDGEIAEHFGLERDRLAGFRERPALQHVAIRRAGALAAYAIYSAGFPGAFVFCADDPSMARLLLDACRAHADLARFDFTRIIVTGDAALAGALIEAGASVTLELFQMGGSLP